MTKERERRTARVLARHGLTVEQIRTHGDAIRSLIARSTT